MTYDQWKTRSDRDDETLGPPPVERDYKGIITHEFPPGMFVPEETWCAWRGWVTDVFGLGATEADAVEDLCNREDEEDR